MAVASGAVVLAVLGASGAAVADGLIGSSGIRDGGVRSADIRDGGIRSADIRDGGVRSADIRDGGVAWKDLRPGVKKRIDVPGPAGAVGATGEKGEAGAKGDTGARGLQGARGADGTDGEDGTDGINGTNGFSGYEVAFPEDAATATGLRVLTAPCPSGKVAIGGGAKAAGNPRDVVIHGSYPSHMARVSNSNNGPVGIWHATSWTVELSVLDGDFVQPYAICVSSGLPIIVS